MARKSYKTITHDVWNILDEYGLILNAPRKLGESNYDYQKRLMQLVKLETGASRQGLINYISIRLGLQTYRIYGKRIFNLTYHPVDKDKDLNPLPITVYLNGVQQTVHTESSWATATDGCIVWKENDNTYTTILEFKNAPNDGDTIDIYYYTFYNEEYVQFHEVFTGEGAQTPTKDQVKVYSITDTEFINQFKQPDGSLSPEYYNLLKTINQYYRRTWGEFVWDNFYWDEGSRLQVIKSYYDSPTVIEPNKLINGVCGEDSLKIIEIKDDGTTIINPGYFFLNGKLYYFYAMKVANTYDPNNYTTPPSEFPLQVHYVDTNNNAISLNVFHGYGRPIALKYGQDSRLNIGYGGDALRWQNEPGVNYIEPGDSSIANIAEQYQYPVLRYMEKQETSTDSSTDYAAHSHTWKFYDDIVEAANHNGVTDPAEDGHYHEIVNGAVQPGGTDNHTHTITVPLDYGYKELTPQHIRKRISPPTSVDIPDDNDYFLINVREDGTYIQPSDNSQQYTVEFDLTNDYATIGGPDFIDLDSNHSYLAGTFIGLADDARIDKVNVYLSRSSIRQNQRLGITVEVLDTNNSLVPGVEVIITPSANFKISDISPNTNKEHIVLGHTYTDGTVYGELYVTSGPTTPPATLQLTITVRQRTKQTFDTAPAATNGTINVYELTTTVEVRYDG